MTAPDNLYQLVDKFERDQSKFRQPDYNEAQLRQEFVNKFFAALGWDVGDSGQVLHEAGLRSGGSVKHPDYSFLAASRRAFYVETKKPSINIGNSVEPAEQLRSYGWSGNTALGILTNFAEFAVYDCRIEPRQGDSPAEARVLYLTHSQYLTEWERLRETLSPEAVRQGKHSDLLEATAKGVLRVDEAFLRDLENWRVDLAPDIYKQARFINRQLSQREINHLVQRTIDRIVFLRIAEDRNLESYGRLERAASVRRNSYNEIKTLYLDADRKYNSGLFHFDPSDKSRPDADTLSLGIRIGDGILRKIIGDLYPPRSRYQFSVISADILGQVYERFLGKVIEVHSDGETTSVTVEEKPEVRKAGGVYYTPGYIVDYIVKNTVGALLEGKSPDEAMKLRILDPACGSGSFLTGAYQYLLDWHLAQYQKAPQRYRNRLRRVVGGYVLDIREKRRILLNSVYGVDLDQNAVEVSKLSLLLKMLENEQDTAEIKEPLLPDLSGNIKWGNSLIGSDFYSPAELAAKDDEELYRVKPFDWAGASGFGEIMAAGGFDAVIGNPPYVRQETLGKEFKAYAKDKYETYAGAADLYTYFIERGVKLLNESGLFGIIVANKWLRARYGKPLRQWLKKQALREIVDFGDLPVFEQATTYPCILTIGKGGASDTFAAAQVDTLEFASLREHLESLRYSVDRTMLDDGGWSLARQEVQVLVNRLMTTLPSLESYVEKEIYRGVTTGLNEAFVIDGDTRARLVEENPNSAELIKPFLAGREVKRYSILAPSKYLIFTRRGVDIKSFPAIHRYLHQFKSRLEPKPKDWLGDAWSGRKPGSYKWFEIQDTVDYWQSFEKPKIILPDISLRGNFTYDEKHAFVANTGYIIPVDDKYLLGVLNSKLTTFIYGSISSTYRGGYLRFIYQYLAQLPIRVINFDNPDDVAMHDEMVALVDTMLGLHKQLPELAGIKREVIEAQIEATDREIDGLVYRLYGLAEGEVGIVEGG